MSTFVIINRAPKGYRGGPDTMAAWNDWFDRLGDHLVDRGNPVFTRTTLGNADEATDLGGYTLIRAADLDEATALAQTCPAIDAGGGVEIGELTLLH